MLFNEFQVGQRVWHGDRSSIALVSLTRHYFEEKSLADGDRGYLEIIEAKHTRGGYWNICLHKWRSGWGHRLYGFETVDHARAGLEAVWMSRHVDQLMGYLGQSRDIWFYSY